MANFMKFQNIAKSAIISLDNGKFSEAGKQIADIYKYSLIDN